MYEDAIGDCELFIPLFRFCGGLEVVLSSQFLDQGVCCLVLFFGRECCRERRRDA